MVQFGPLVLERQGKEERGRRGKCDGKEGRKKGRERFTEVGLLCRAPYVNVPERSFTREFSAEESSVETVMR